MNTVEFVLKFKSFQTSISCGKQAIYGKKPLDIDPQYLEMP